LVVPCYDEADRFDSAEFARLLDNPRWSLLFVDDGSNDTTPDVLAHFCAGAGGRAELLRLDHNSGKGEAVRQGFLRALDSDAPIIGYADADLATPIEEMWRMLGVLDEMDVSAVIGSRVALLGLNIDRNATRHYMGRLFATAVSLVLSERVYDTQCGAKLFCADDALRAAIRDPFLSRWAFDVELLGRLLREGASVVEVPLRRWRDVPGSKLSPRAMFRAAADLARIRRDLRRR
jgi:glycosyltransferase involved in cell wall biosynthesis